ncbi:MAG TPA: hypothetical protein VN175_08840 [Rhizomicrobium sp.]|nr:hypothetical protein [Rhizomicrobium sp.]
MRYRVLILVAAWMSGWSNAAFCDDGSSDDRPPALLHDPSLATSVYFPPALTTAGVADTGPALSLMKPRGSGCTVLMPCAVTSPPLDRAVRP